jgi:cell surface protein SprA
MQDPSTDDFRHFRDDSFEATKSGILERYQDFNGVEGNSPLGGNPAPGGFTRQATQNPDTEDINRNGTPNTAEEYWEYKIDLKRSSMIPGQNYIVDRVDTVVNAGPNASQQVPVTWFQFRIPLASGTARNNIPNFKAINFMRMYLTGFKQDVILRMTEFQLVSSQWRRFTGNLQELAQDTMPDEPPFATFQVGSVSLEENSTKEPFNYMLPPGIVQQNLNGNTQVGFLQNERSLTMQMCGLEDGDARGIFRVVNYDLRNYQKLKMWIHAEARTDGIQPPNFDQVGDASAFIRLGLDNDLNYYEYEIPLTPSDISLGGNNVNNVWPAGNQMDFELALLGVAKGLRNQDQYPLNDRYKFTQGLPPGHAIYVKGTPKTSDIRTIMIGIRNPKDSLGIDIDPICLEAWVNELRLTDYDNASGWAANANLSVKLADFGNITASASRRTFGFGALDQQLSERVRESIFRYNIAANLALGKLFPQKWGIQLPVYLTYGEQMLTPQFDPREADVLTEKLLEQLSPEEKTEALKKIQDFQRTQSISFNNVKKNKTNPDSKSHPWDFSNLDFTFSYNELLARSANVERRFTTRHSAAINYRYNFKPVSFQPFKNWKRRNPISLFNISPVPSSVSVSVAGDRSFQENRIRPSPTFGGNIMPTYQKNFLITRNYALAWNLTQNLNLNFTATNVARVDEVHGYWDEATQEERDSVGPIWRNILSFGRDSLYGNNQLINFGRTIGYNHNITASYQLPFSQYSWTDWLSGNINYTASFMWSQAPEITPSIGNVITNSQNIQASGRVDLKGLYRKVGLLKLMDKLKVKKGDQPKKPGEKETKGKKDQDDNKPGLEEPGKKDDKTKKEEEEESDPFYFLKVITSEVLRVIFSIQSVDLTYGQNNSTLLPGFLPQTDNFGLDFRYTDTATMMASPVIPPTVGFILGSQRDIRGVAGENGWITRDTTLSNYFATNYSEQFTARTSVELFKGFRVDINVNRNLTENYSELFRWDDFMQDYNSFNRQVNGTFTMSYIMGLSTLFEKSLDSENRVLPSSSFQEFDQYRILISQRLDQLNPNSVDLGYRGRLSDGYYNGYTRTHQEVLVSAFLSAYGPVKPEKIQLSAFPKIPLPNWSVNYNGLTQIPALKKIFTNVSLRHTYRGTYTVGSYNLNLEARVTGVDQDFSGETRALGTDTLSSGFVVDKVNFQPVRNITIVQMSEQFSPLIGVNMNFKNGMTASIDYKTGRQISLSIGNLQLTESNNKDLSVMFGLRKDNLNLVVNLFGKVLDLKNSANFQFRLSMRDTREINRTLDSFQDPIITRGNYSFSLNPSIDYVVNNRLNLRLFFEQNINRPYTSNSFNTSFSSGGLQLRFMLN